MFHAYIQNIALSDDIRLQLVPAVSPICTRASPINVGIVEAEFEDEVIELLLEFGRRFWRLVFPG
jgi:hypothetical protein